METPVWLRWRSFALYSSLLATVFGLAFFSGPSAAFATREPIAAYSFDEGEGATVEDLTGDGHDGTIEGATWTTHGKFGGALEFDGENDCLTIPNDSQLQLAEEFTLEAWVKPQGAGSEEPILVKEDSSWFGYALFFGGSEANRLAGYLGEEGKVTRGTQNSATSPKNAWSHVALTFDGARMRLYVDGQQVDDTTANGPMATNGQLSIGCSKGGEEFFDGKIDEVRIYNRALSEQEVEPDLTPPSQPTELDAMFEEEEEENTFVTWNPSTDPPQPDGYPGSGVVGYLYRYRIEGGAWSSWQRTPYASFGIAGTTENEHLQVAVMAEDTEGNVSPMRHARLVTTPSALSESDLGEEAPNEFGEEEITSEPEHVNPEESAAPHTKSELSGDELCPAVENPCGKYDWKEAMRYAERWTYPGRNNEYVAEHHNHEFLYLGEAGGDCTNYASQVLWAGNMQFMRTNGNDSPDIDANGEDHFGDYRYGQGSWWSGYYYDFMQPPKLFRTPTESWDNAHKLFEHLVEYGLAEPLNGSPVRAGDLVFYDLYHGTSIEHIDHTQVIERVTHHYIWVAQHSQAFERTLKHEREHVRQKYGVRGVDWEMWIIRPVHTKANL